MMENRFSFIMQKIIYKDILVRLYGSCVVLFSMKVFVLQIVSIVLYSHWQRIRDFIFSIFGQHFIMGNLKTLANLMKVFIITGMIVLNLSHSY